MVGILTYYDAINYGAALQAYAIQETVKLLTCDPSVGVVGYCPEAVKSDYSLIKTGIKPFIVSMLNLADNKKRHAVFDCFIQDNIHVLSIEQAKQADTLILGSDQIWNPNISRGFDQAFFGKIEGASPKRVVSYAASIGVSKLKNHEMCELKELLDNVDAISVREEDAKHLIHEAGCDKPVTVDVDPTLLLDQAQWMKVAKETEVSAPYILVYSLSGYAKTFETARIAAEKYGAEVVEVTLKDRKPFHQVKHRQIKAAGPADFLGLIADASVVVTDSFHGTVFSLIFQKRFFTIPNRTKGARMIGLLNMLNLPEYIVFENSESLCFNAIDYQRVNADLERCRSESLDHLRKALVLTKER